MAPTHHIHDAFGDQESTPLIHVVIADAEIAHVDARNFSP
jgi:hypothetical protein